MHCLEKCKMVFETIVVRVVNKYLGQFVENLDSSQLSIGLLGGMLYVALE